MFCCVFNILKPFHFEALWSGGSWEAALSVMRAQGGGRRAFSVFLLFFMEWFGDIGVLVGAGWEAVHVALVGEGDVGKARCQSRRGVLQRGCGAGLPGAAQPSPGERSGRVNTKVYNL